ncbi:MAG: LysE family transporter [Ignavibacteriaceae bacterium]
MVSYLIFGITYGFAAAAQPGPLQTYIISQTFTNGWRRTLPASFSPLISDIPIILIVLFLLSHLPFWLIQFLHLAGALFLFYLTYDTYKTWKNLDSNKKTTVQPNQQTLFKAALVNFLNPNPYLGWSLVMGPLFLRGYNEAPLNGIALIISFYSTLVAGIAGIIFLFAFARNLGPKIVKTMLGISVVGLAFFGIYQLWLVFN